jgi:hypothetical protein
MSASRVKQPGTFDFMLSSFWWCSTVQRTAQPKQANVKSVLYSVHCTRSQPSKQPVCAAKESTVPVRQWSGVVWLVAGWWLSVACLAGGSSSNLLIFRIRAHAGHLCALCTRVQCTHCPSIHPNPTVAHRRTFLSHWRVPWRCKTTPKSRSIGALRVVHARTVLTRQKLLMCT